MGSGGSRSARSLWMATNRYVLQHQNLNSESCHVVTIADYNERNGFVENLSNLTPKWKPVKRFITDISEEWKK